jgi:hypothetical protein
MHKLILLFLALTSTLAVAQTEGDLRNFFLGKHVALKIDMPANKAGVDIQPRHSVPFDYAEYAQRLRKYGVAIRNGESGMITKIKVNSKNIEFHLDGGGFGAAGDDTSTSVYVPSVEKSRREKDLERAIKDEKDADRKRRMERERDDLRRDREREDERNRTLAASTEAVRKEAVRTRALQAGSRFNLEFPDGVPADALTPQSVMTALSKWVDFPAAEFADAPSVSEPAEGSKASAPILRKGMTEADVRAAIGESRKRLSRVIENGLQMTMATYARPDGDLEATFVEGVLVKWALIGN